MSCQFRYAWWSSFRQASPQSLLTRSSRQRIVSTVDTRFLPHRSLSLCPLEKLLFHRKGYSCACALKELFPSQGLRIVRFSTAREEDLETRNPRERRLLDSEKDGILRDTMITTQNTIQEVLSTMSSLHRRYTIVLRRVERSTYIPAEHDRHLNLSVSRRPTVSSQETPISSLDLVQTVPYTFNVSFLDDKDEFTPSRSDNATPIRSSDDEEFSSSFNKIDSSKAIDDIEKTSSSENLSNVSTSPMSSLIDLLSAGRDRNSGINERKEDLISPAMFDQQASFNENAVNVSKYIDDSMGFDDDKDDDPRVQSIPAEDGMEKQLSPSSISFGGKIHDSISIESKSEGMENSYAESWTSINLNDKSTTMKDFDISESITLQSDGIDAGFVDQVDTGIEETKYNELIAQGIAFLEVMTTKHWRVFNQEADNDDEEPDGDDKVHRKTFESLPAIDTSSDEIEMILDEPIEVVSHSTEVNGESSESERWRKLEALLIDTLSGNQSLTTEEFNVILLQLACSTVYQSRDVVKMIIQVFNHMNSRDTLASPDGFTYAIVILCLYKRGDALFEACQLISEMTHQTHLFHNSEALIQAMKCLEFSKRYDLAEELMDQVRNNEQHRVRIPSEAVESMLTAYQKEKKVLDAVDLIDHYIERMGPGPYIPYLLQKAANWSQRRSTHQDRVILYQFLVQKSKSYETTINTNSQIAIKLWRTLIVNISKARSKTDTQDMTFSELIRECLWRLLHRDTLYCPDFELTQYALSAACALEDAELSIALMQRLLLNQWSIHSDRHFDEFREEVKDHSIGASLIAPNFFEVAIKTCAAAKCVSSLSALLTLLNHPDVMFPSDLRAQFMIQILLGFLNTCEWQRSIAILESMAGEGLTIKEGLCAFIIQRIALNHQPSDALQLIQDVESGKYGNVQIGSACYTSKILTLLKLKDWQGVVETHNEMKTLGMRSNAVATHAAVLASARLGNTNDVVQVLREAIDSGTSLNKACFEHSLKCLCPDLAGKDGTIRAARQELRERVDKDRKSELAAKYLNLSKLMRIAQVEEDRRISKTCGEREINLRRRKAWAEAHQALIDLHLLMV